MKYLFFDIECCNGYDMCSFGYVLADDKLNIIKKEDIVINPNAKFKLGRAGFDPRINLAYREEYIRKQQKFPYYYENIKNILTDKNTIILGHAVSGDINYIDIACDRYKLKKFGIKAFDTQNFYYQLNKEYKQRSLINILNDLEISINDLTEHKSSDDAEMSLIYTKEICQRLNISINELLELCETSISTGKQEGLRTFNFKKHLNILFEKYPNRNKYTSICFSETIKESVPQKRLELIKAMLENKYNYTAKVSECSYFVKGKEYGERDLSCDHHIEDNHKPIKKITLDELAEMLNININDHGEIYTPTAMEIAYKKALSS